MFIWLTTKRTQSKGTPIIVNMSLVQAFGPLDDGDGSWLVGDEFDLKVTEDTANICEMLKEKGEY